MLNGQNIAFTYREYTEEPLNEEELKEVMRKLNHPANLLLRKRDPAYKELGLSGDEDDGVLIPHFAQYPTLMQRPIGVLGEKAIVGRPADLLLKLVE